MIILGVLAGISFGVGVIILMRLSLRWVARVIVANAERRMGC